jgi:Leucine-rich repeat (LRR) protein
MSKTFLNISGIFDCAYYDLSLITRLILADNLITEIVNVPINICYLDLSNNKLMHIPALHNFIKYLYLSDNLITKITKLPSSLLELDLSGNFIKHMVLFPQKIKRLYLANNNIKIVGKIPNNLYLLDLSGNPIKKACYINVYELYGNSFVTNIC